MRLVLTAKCIIVNTSTVSIGYRSDTLTCQKKLSSRVTITGSELHEGFCYAFKLIGPPLHPSPNQA